MVLGLMARLTRLMSTWRVYGSTGIVCTLMPMYAAPLSNAACAEIGITLENVPAPKLSGVSIEDRAWPHTSPAR